MKDRIPLYPGRVKLIPVAGQENTFDMVRADQPTQEGTKLDKNALLKDSTAVALGLATSAVPDDALLALKAHADENTERILNGVKCEVSEYTVATGVDGGTLTVIFNFGFRPKVWFPLMYYAADTKDFRGISEDYWPHGLPWKEGETQTIWGGPNKRTLCNVTYSGNTLRVNLYNSFYKEGDIFRALAIGWGA